MGYSEDLPSVGFNGVSSGYYFRKHNPWVNWQSSPLNGYPITVNQPLTALPSDFNDLPAVSFIVPNQLHDMHDGTVQQGDTWLQNNLNAYVTWSKTHNSLFILTFDEDNNTSPNQIVTIFIGEKVLAGQYSQYISHYNILRTIEDIHSIPRAGASDTASPIINCWLPLTNIVTNSVPAEFILEQNYPNPFNPSTKIKYELPSDNFVSLKVFDILGNEIETLVNQKQPAGNYSVDFSSLGLSSGIYYYEMNAGKYEETKSMIVLK